MERSKPYVISQDVGLLVSSWGLKSGFSVPRESYFKGMTLDLENTLKTIFPVVDVIKSDELMKGMTSMVEGCDLPVVSLDRCYINKNIRNVCGFLDVSRCVNEKLEKFGISGRNIGGIDAQLDKICATLKPNEKKIAIADDVLFEGKTHKFVSDLFKNRGVEVGKVIVGVSIGDGKSLLENQGIKVLSLINYESVIDEICERDFSAGVPFSGRTVLTNEGVYGAPYFLPFGKPEEWASIPTERVKQFSEYCLESSVKLWQNIEKRSKKKISTEEVPKRIFGLMKSDSIVDALKSNR